MIAMIRWSLTERVDLLKSTKVFTKTPEIILQNIAEVLEEALFQPGERMLHQDTYGQYIYFLVKGKVRVCQGNALSEELEDKGMIGIAPLLYPQGIIYSAITLSDCWCWRLSREHFYQFIAPQADVMQALIKGVISAIQNPLPTPQLEPNHEDVLVRKYKELILTLEQIEGLNHRLQAQEIALHQSAIVTISDLAGNILFANDKLCEISKYSHEELIGKNHSLLNSGYHPKEYFKEMWRTIAGGKLWRGELRNKAKDGAYYWVDTAIAPILDEKGKPYQYYSIRFDITEKKKSANQIRLKNEKITSSINYARQIQKAILKSDQKVTSSFPGAFIFNKPKDIVSGDFYWYEEITEVIDNGQDTNPEVNQYKILIAADCTGHGVPGAFMTVMGNALLNEIIKVHHIIQPYQILQILDNRIVEMFGTYDRQPKIRDGIDLAILLIDEHNQKMYYAGAFNPLLYVRNGEIHQIDGAKFPVGGSPLKIKKVFTQHVIDIQKGDVFYIFSDGFQDQFGGPERKKYLKRRFREFLKSISHLSMPEQREKVLAEFLKWKGPTAQTDDILVLGVQF